MEKNVKKLALALLFVGCAFVFAVYVILLGATLLEGGATANKAVALEAAELPMIVVELVCVFELLLIAVWGTCKLIAAVVKARKK